MKNAFSLIELTIVLVIIGLIIGGITAGQNLIRAAQLQSVITEKKKYEASIAAFQEKYFALPGDFNNATAFWGAAHTTAATCKTTASTGKETCNGDGDGTIDDSTASAEQLRFWQHLANSGLIEGSFTGISGAYVPGINVPASKISSSGWTATLRGTYGTPYGDASFLTVLYNNTLQFGAQTSGSTYGAAITPEEAWNIDQKQDDGRPGYGATIALDWSTCTNASSTTDINTTYKLTSSSIGCALVFRNYY